MQRVTVQDIARAVGVSNSTVSKALSNQDGVNQRTREEILLAAKRMGYRVNNVAQSLSRKEIKIGVVCPLVWPQFYGQIKYGIDMELEHLSDFKVSKVDVPTKANMTQEELRDVCLDLIGQGTTAIIFCMDITMDYTLAAAELKRHNIPFAVVGNLLPQRDFSLCVRVDSYQAGRLAGEYLRHLVPADGDVAVLIANHKICDHTDKVRGFLSEFDPQGNHLEGVYETQDQSAQGYEIAKSLLKTQRNLKGIYIATVNSESVCECLFQNHREDIRLVVTDVFPELGFYVHHRVIDGIIFQDTIRQGRVVVRQLYNAIVSRKQMRLDLRIPPQLVLRTNFDAYLNKEAAHLQSIL